MLPPFPPLQRWPDQPSAGLPCFWRRGFSQSQQTKAQLMLNDKMRRRELYRDVVNDGSALRVNALTSEPPILGKLVGLYALISRMRIVAGHQRRGELRRPSDLQCPLLTQQELADIGTMVNQDVFDPMKRFSELCCSELEALH
jgi:hypothetical protein